MSDHTQVAITKLATKLDDVQARVESLERDKRGLAKENEDLRARVQAV